MTWATPLACRSWPMTRDMSCPPPFASWSADRALPADQGPAPAVVRYSLRGRGRQPTRWAGSAASVGDLERRLAEDRRLPERRANDRAGGARRHAERRRQGIQHEPILRASRTADTDRPNRRSRSRCCPGAVASRPRRAREAGPPVGSAGRSSTIQWTKSLASGSSTRSTSESAPAGTPDQLSAGETLSPSHVYSRGMAPPSMKADDVSRNGTTGPDGAADPMAQQSRPARRTGWHRHPFPSRPSRGPATAKAPRCCRARPWPPAPPPRIRMARRGTADPNPAHETVTRARAPRTRASGMVKDGASRPPLRSESALASNPAGARPRRAWPPVPVHVVVLLDPLRPRRIRPIPDEPLAERERGRPIDDLRRHEERSHQPTPEGVAGIPGQQPHDGRRGDPAGEDQDVPRLAQEARPGHLRLGALARCDRILIGQLGVGVRPAAPCHSSPACRPSNTGADTVSTTRSDRTARRSAAVGGSKGVPESGPSRCRFSIARIPVLPRHIVRPPRPGVNGSASRLERMYHYHPVDDPWTTHIHRCTNRWTTPPSVWTNASRAWMNTIRAWMAQTTTCSARVPTNNHYILWFWG